MCVKIRRLQHTRVHAHTKARGATPELRRVTDTIFHGLSAGTAGTPPHKLSQQVALLVCVVDQRPKGRGGGEAAIFLLGLEPDARLGL